MNTITGIDVGIKAGRIVKYRNDFFTSYVLDWNGHEIRTHFREKAERHGLEHKSRNPGSHGGFFGHVLDEEVEKIGPFYCRYRVKYHSNFFTVYDESSDKITLLGHVWFAERYGFEIYGRELSKKTVPAEDVIQIKDLNEKLGFYSFTDTSGGYVYNIIDENDTSYLLQKEIPQEKSQYFPYFTYIFKYITDLERDWVENQKRYIRFWVPKERVFVYNENDIPLRY